MNRAFAALPHPSELAGLNQSANSIPQKRQLPVAVRLTANRRQKRVSSADCDLSAMAVQKID